MREIPLTRGYVAIVDDEDYERVAQFKWCAAKGRYTNYALRRLACGRGIYLHRAIMQIDDDRQVDHVDGNGLNNQKSNLRACAHRQNIQNRPKRWGSLAAYKGVWKHRVSGRWYADIQCNRRRSRFGPFDTEVEAAVAYDDAARNLHGEFASVNFPSDGERGALG